MDNNEKVVYVVKENEKKTNGPGIAGFVLGLVSLFTAWLAGIPIIGAIIGLILSIVGMNKKNAGKGLAIAGLIINILSIISNIIAMICIFVPLVFGVALAGIGTVSTVGSYNSYINEAQTKASVKEAIMTAIADPEVISASDYTVFEEYTDGDRYYLSDIKDSTFRDVLEEQLGDLDNSEYSEISFSIDGMNVIVY